VESEQMISKSGDELALSVDIDASLVTQLVTSQFRFKGVRETRFSLGRTGTASLSESDSQSDSQSDGLPWTRADEYGQRVVADVYAMDLNGPPYTCHPKITKHAAAS
jgi:hypothetical protein